MSLSGSFRPASVLLVLLLVMQGTDARRLGVKTGARNSSISAIFVFGDSTVDSGNNNYIVTISKSNFPPYGKDFPGQVPTGRFTNGKLVTDYLASYAGIKDYIPPYLDPTLSLDDLKTGVCFASAGTGFDALTAQINGPAITVETQLKHFKEYKSRMEKEIGKEKTRGLISKAVFLVSAGTNDFMANYYSPTQTRSRAYTISAYRDFLLQLGQQLVEGLLEMGGKKVAVVGLPPIGCVPAVITLHSDNALLHRGCIQNLSAVARDYNRLLQDKLAALERRSTRGTAIVYVDIYSPIAQMVSNPQNYGFEIVDRGCCGTGMIEFTVMCNSISLVCSDDSKYLFWDAVHPSQAAYYSIFLSLRPVIDRFLN